MTGRDAGRFVKRWLTSSIRGLLIRCRSTFYFLSLIFKRMQNLPLTGNRIEDNKLANWTYQLLGGMFLRTLSEFQLKGMLGPNTEVRNLGGIRAL